MTNFELIFLASADDLAARAASGWLDEIEAARQAGQTQSVALSGGHIARNFFAAAASQAAARKISMAGVHFFWADERCVPPDDLGSNFRLANELLFAPLEIPSNQIHRIRGEDAPQTAVKTAEGELRRFAAGGPGAGVPRLDLVFLGMGPDGHVASLFPDATDEILNCPAPFLAVENSPKPPPKRISLSYTSLAAAKRVWGLVSGAGKEAALRKSLRPGALTPLARVLASRPHTKIFTDIPLD